MRPRNDTAPRGELTRLSVLAPPGEQVYPDSTGVAISPDGTMVAFVVGAESRTDTELWVRHLGSMKAQRLDDAGGANLPFWSPDSERIGFFTNTKLKTIAASGGRAETLCDAPGGRGAAWSPQNVIVFAPDAGGPLFRIAASGGTPVPVTTLDAERKEFGHRFPSFLPDGEHFLYASLLGKGGKFDIFVGSIKDPSRTLIGSLEASPVYAPSTGSGQAEQGFLLYARQGVLAAVPFDARALRITGDPRMLEDEPAAILDPATSFTAGQSVSVSRTGSLAYYSTPSLNTIAQWYDVSGARLGALSVPAGHYESVTISPDGAHAVLVRSTSPSESSLWLTDLARGGASPLASGRGRNDSPVWAPDSSRIVFAVDRDGPQDLYIKGVSDATPETLVSKSDVPFRNPSSWSRDGQWITMTQLDPDTAQNVWLLPATGDKKPTPLIRGPVRDIGGPISPDGRWMAYAADDSGRFEIYVQPFPTTGRRVQVSDSGALGAWWTRDGRQLVLLGTDSKSLWRVEVEPGAELRAGTPRQIASLPPGIVSIDAMPDRQRFLAIEPERTGTGSVTVVQHWIAALK